MSYHSRRNPGTLGAPWDRPIAVPGHGIVVTVGPVEHVGPRANPYRYEAEGPYSANYVEIVFGLRAGKKFVANDDRRQYRPMEAIDPRDVKRTTLRLRGHQVGRSMVGLTFAPAEGRYRSTPERTLRIFLYPQGQGDVESGKAPEITGAGNAARFFANVDDLVRVLGEEFEQDQIILNLVRNGRGQVEFLNWKPY